MPAIIRDFAWKLAEAVFIGASVWFGTFVCAAAFLDASFAASVLLATATGVATFCAALAGE